MGLEAELVVMFFSVCWRFREYKLHYACYMHDCFDDYFETPWHAELTK
jgi:hypothetical protein